MDEPNFRKRVLVAPLNWGLGHAARCVPIIKSLVSRGHEVFLASDGAAMGLLRAEFPSLPLFELPAYGIRYGFENMVLNVAGGLPSMIRAVADEHRATEKWARELRLDAVVSDNRYGCFSNKCPSVIISHQLHLQAPSKWLAMPANWALKNAIARFEEVWVPDVEAEPNLSGRLSHGPSRHPKTRFIGILSRMRALSDRPIERDVAVVLSGPEPQRSVFEEKIMEQALALTDVRFAVVQGKTRSKSHHFAAEHIEVVSFLTASELNELLARSRTVVCRSGYSSLMDLAVLGKKAALSPTPGQTEQELLAQNFMEKGIFYAQTQRYFDLKTALAKADSFSGLRPGDFSASDFEAALDALLGR